MEYRVLEQSIILVQIIFIDIIMAADNAIIIAMIAANFAPKNRKQIIMYGVLAAFLFRIIFAFSATYLFGFPIIKIVGGALLIWIVHDLQQDLFGKQKKLNLQQRFQKNHPICKVCIKLFLQTLH